MKLPFIHWIKNLDTKPSYSPTWPWPTCGSLQTLSFRASNVYYDDSFCILNSTSSSSKSHSTMSDELDDPVENAIRSLRSDRLFLEPERRRSLVYAPMNVEIEKSKIYFTTIEDEQDEEESERINKESEILIMDSNDPFEDIGRSMKEMVEAHGLKEWHQLEELLECYLKINDKRNHGYIIGAFVDLLVSLSFTKTTLTNSSTNLTSSSSSSSSLLSTHSIYSFPSSSLTTILDNGNDMMNHDEGHNSHCHFIS